MTDHGHGHETDPKRSRLDKMLAAGRITPDEAETVRAATQSGDDADSVIGDIRRRHVLQWIATEVERGRWSEHDAAEMSAAIERGDDPRAVLRRHRRSDA